MQAVWSQGPHTELSHLIASGKFRPKRDMKKILIGTQEQHFTRSQFHPGVKLENEEVQTVDWDLGQLGAP